MCADKIASRPCVSLRFAFDLRLDVQLGSSPVTGSKRVKSEESVQGNSVKLKESGPAHSPPVLVVVDLVVGLHSEPAGDRAMEGGESRGSRCE